MAYSYPEFEDLVLMSLTELYKRFRRPIPASVLSAAMKVDMPESTWRVGEVEEALEDLRGRELIKKDRMGYKPLDVSGALVQQMGLEEVVPFTREPGEVPESHMDRVWHGDIRDLKKPTLGNEYGLYPVVQFQKDRVWRGLTRED